MKALEPVRNDKTALKTINETAKNLRLQPVGGLGALIQKSNIKPEPIRRIPTTFYSAPAVSSLPYLSEEQKVKTNESILMLSAHIANQKEQARASWNYDDKEQAKLEDNIEENIKQVAKSYNPTTEQLMRDYLSKEIGKRRQEELDIQNKRFARIDAELNPPYKAPNLPTITAGDVGRPEVPTREELFDRLQESLDRIAQESENRELKRQGFEALKAPVVQRENLELLRALKAKKEAQLISEEPQIRSQLEKLSLTALRKYLKDVPTTEIQKIGESRKGLTTKANQEKLITSLIQLRNKGSVKIPLPKIPSGIPV